ncbi:MAG: polymerase subunit delta [Candidatus Peribacteria bacterium]|nr:polymerase subunit delta [Candidatus Peribacteria bacterium]
MSINQNILGHTLQLSALQNDIQTDNVSHAYLFTGPPHIGKFTVAKWFASTLLTKDIADGEEKKRAEYEVEKLIHPDIFVLDQLWMEDRNENFDMIAKSSNIPQQHRMKSKAKTDTISIEDVRVLQERLYEIGSGAHRCCLIRSVERMQDEAVNALLKIVEEPPPGMVFVLTAESAGAVLPTLVSRSRVVEFQRLPQADLSPLLTDTDPDDAQFMLMIAQGAPGVIVALKSSPDTLRTARTVHASAVSFWRSRRLFERLTLLSPIEKRGNDSESLLFHLSLALHADPAEKKGAYGDALMELLRGLDTNASRPLLLQRFALAVTP